MKEGIVLQVAPPLDMYNAPANKFVAGFIGSPPMNFFEVRVGKDAKDVARSVFLHPALGFTPLVQQDLTCVRLRVPECASWCRPWPGSPGSYRGRSQQCGNDD